MSYMSFVAGGELSKGIKNAVGEMSDTRTKLNSSFEHVHIPTELFTLEIETRTPVRELQISNCSSVHVL